MYCQFKLVPPFPPPAPRVGPRLCRLYVRRAVTVTAAGAWPRIGTPRSGAAGNPSRYSGRPPATTPAISAGHALAYLLDAREHCAVTPAWSSLTREGIRHETRTDLG